MLRLLLPMTFALLLLFPAMVLGSTPVYHTITAFVVNAAGQPMQGVEIEMTNSSGSNVTTYYMHTNSSGMAERSVPAGIYNVSATLSGYAANRTYTVDILAANATVYYKMTELMVNLTGFITTGRVPVANATVVLSNTSVTYRTHSTSPLGEYTWHGVQPGEYAVSASKAGYLTNYTAITLSPGSSVWLNLTLIPTNGILEGTVNESQVNGRELPVANATITIQGNGVLLHLLTSSTGTFVATNLQGGTYTVSVSKTGYSPGQGTVTVYNGKIAYLNFTLVPLSNPPPLNIPGFIGKLDLDHSLVIVALVVIIFVSAGTVALLNKSYNWREERNTEKKEKSR
ncbi:MAG: carboxypeptidase-like regulatory domain-containing protein [Methanomassiliicoccales archaeon]